MDNFFPLVIVLLWSALWVVEFVQLMLVEDRLFMGRHDKALWVAAFLVMFPLAPIAFHLWKKAQSVKG